MKPKTTEQEKQWRDKKIAILQDQIEVTQKQIDYLEKRLQTRKSNFDDLMSRKFIEDHQITKDQVLTKKEYGYVGTVYDLKDKLEGWKWVEWNERIYPTEALHQIFNKTIQDFYPSIKFLEE